MVNKYHMALPSFLPNFYQMVNYEVNFTARTKVPFATVLRTSTHKRNPAVTVDTQLMKNIRNTF